MPGQQAKRPLCGNVDVVGVNLIHLPGHGTACSQRQPNFRIGRHRQCPEFLGRQVVDVVPLGDQRLADAFESAHDAIDLRPPGIGDDKDAAGVVSVEGMGHGNTTTGLSVQPRSSESTSLV